MNELKISSDLNKVIYVIRNQRVILDSDLAKIYGVPTSILNKAVTRNQSRFPNDFMFQLTNQEVTALRFQNGISNIEGRGGRRYLPYAFTQEGIAMLSGLLNSAEATRANIEIMRTFVKLREFALEHQDLALKIKLLEQKYDGKFKIVFQALKKLVSETSTPRKRIAPLKPEK